MCLTLLHSEKPKLYTGLKLNIPLFVSILPRKFLESGQVDLSSSLMRVCTVCHSISAPGKKGNRYNLILLHSKWPKLYGLRVIFVSPAKQKRDIWTAFPASLSSSLSSPL